MSTTRLCLIALASSSLLTLMASAQSPTLLPPGTTRPAAPRPAPATPAPAIATVGGRRIATQEFEARVAAGLRQYRERAGAEVPEEFLPTIRRQVLESLIRRELMVLQCTQEGTLASEAEAEAELKKDPIFNPGGVFDPERFDAVRTTQPQTFASAKRLLREQIGARRLNERLESRFEPPREEAQRAVERALGRYEVGYLGLPLADFPGTYPEPREADVLAAYRRDPESFRRPARAVLSVVPFETGPVRLGDSPEYTREQLRARADSLIADLRRGTPLEAAAAPYGGARGGVVVAPGNFPGFWQGDARDADAVFAGRPGDVLGPVRARAGWVVVRIDEARPARIAPIQEVAHEIRSRLRAEALANRDERVLRALYAEVGPTLRGPALRVRWAWVDTSRVEIPPPTTSDLERFLKAHLADYSYFDERSASVRSRTLAEVEADVRGRWLAERRDQVSRETLGAIERAWRRRSRDGAAERRASGVLEAGPIPPEASLGDSPAAAAVADSIRRLGAVLAVGSGPYGSGRMVFQVTDVVRDHVPTFAQAAPGLRGMLTDRINQEEERGGRALFDRNPAAFERGQLVYITRVFVPTIDVLQVPLTRAEVERYHQENIGRYSAPEEVIASHILVACAEPPGTRADDAARARAEGLLARLRGGESFTRLAQEYSDDAGTRAAGGALGGVASANVPGPVQTAALEAPVGEVVGPVRSEAGYHLVLVTERMPMVAQPLATMWTLVGEDAARKKADLMTAARADSIFAAGRTPEQYRALAARLGLRLGPTSFEASDIPRSSEMRPVLERMYTMKPGEVYPSAFRIPGLGYGIAWVDSTAPARRPRWETSRQAAIDAYRAGRGERALEAKRAELDSMTAQGWSLDSLATLWGGLGTYVHERGSTGLPRLGGARILDSLLVGREGPPPIAPGETTGWVRFATGIARIRFERRSLPEPSQVLARVESNRRAIVERKLADYYEDLKRRWPVRILDAKLAQVTLPPIPEPL